MVIDDHYDDRYGYSYIWLYMVIDIKQKVFTFKHSLNRGIYSPTSKISMQNSVIQALLSCIHLIKECMIFSFTLMISVLFGALITMPA